MATTIYGKIDCYSDIVGASGISDARLTNETYVQAYKFMQYLQTEGVTELYTMYSGSVTSGGSFGVGYWDEPTRFGNFPFSVWRFKPNAATGRSWDWYLMLQCTSGANALDSATAQALPVRTEDNNSAVNAYLFLTAGAFALNATGDSITPWSGSVNTAGSAAKGAIVWTSGSSAGSTVHVFPRINNASGTFVVNKQCMQASTRFGTGGSRTQVRARTHFFSDGDSFLMLQDAASTNGGSPTLAQNYNITYYGPYSMIDAISQSNPGKVLGISGSKGFLAFGSRAENAESTVYSTNTTIPNEVQIGTATATAATREGGVFATTGTGVRVLNLSYGNYNTTTYSPNKLINSGSVYDEKALMVMSVGETNFNGMAGYLNTPLIRSVVGLQSHDVRADGLRAVFGATNTVTLPMASTPWSGSNSPGTGLTRDGINFTITNYSL
jgi:hypothetical protein